MKGSGHTSFLEGFNTTNRKVPLYYARAADSSSMDRVSWLQQRGFDRTWRRGSFVVPSKDVAGKRLAMHVQQQEEDLALAEVALDQMRVAPSGRCRHPGWWC